MNKNLIPVKDHSDLARDPNSGAIISVNRTKYNQAQKRKAAVQRQRNDAQRLQILEGEVAQLKRLVNSLLESKQDIK